MDVKLSVTIITFNEEQNIGRCLKSVEGVADEIVVVDSLSTDRTKEICLAHGVKFVEHPFKGHIEQKNYALAQAAYPHVLSLDADEVLTPELEQAVLSAKRNWQADAYSMNRLTNYCGKWIHHSGWYPDTKTRLFDRRKAIWGGENPHDKIILSKGATLRHLHGDLLHYSYYSVSQHLAQINAFTDASSKAMIRDGKSVSLPMVIIKPVFRFIRAYFLKRGFMDGPEGFIISVSSAVSVYYKYVKLYMHSRQQKRRRQ